MSAIVTRSPTPPTNDQRRADWGCKFYGSGYHRTPRKPRIRLPYPDVQMTRDPNHSCPQDDQF